MSDKNHKGWKETNDILNDPQLEREIREARKQAKCGYIFTLNEVLEQVSRNNKKKELGK